MARLLAEHLARRDDPAVIDDGGVTSWGELDERVNRLIHGLRSAGVRAGDRVALLAGNRREIEEVYLACSHAGWFCVPINWHLAAPEVAYVLTDSGAAALVASGEFAGLAADAIRLEPDASPCCRLLMADDSGVAVALPAGFESYEAALEAASAAEPDDQTLGGVMFYTSGTTGKPKGVRSTRWEPGTPPEALRQMAASMERYGIPPDGRTLLCGPQYHSAQWAFSFLPLVGGSTIVMQHRFNPEAALGLIDQHAITNVHLVPTQFVRFLRLQGALREASGADSLVAVVHGAAPCPPDVKRAMIEWWGPKITEYYGATEGGIVSVITSEEWLLRPGSVGRPLPTVDVRIIGDNGEDAAVGEDGVIHLRSRVGVDFEYLNAPGKTAAAHTLPGYMTINDIGHLDADGYLYLSDRKIDMVISGGVNIYPAEIEAILITHPAVLDVAVFGVPDPEYDEQVKAAVELVAESTWTPELEAEITALCREQLAGYKRPRSFDVVESMPRSAAGKLLKRRLREPYWDDAGRRI